MKGLIVLAAALLYAFPLFAQNKIPWRTSFQTALAEAKQLNKPIYVDAFADWCIWCHKLDENVYSDPAVVRHMQKYVPVKVDVEDSGEGTQFAEQYRIDGLPTLLVTDAEGRVINRISGYLQAQELIADLDFIEQLLESERVNQEDPRLAFQLAEQYLSRDMYAESKARFEKVLALPSATPQQKEDSSFFLALTEYYSGEHRRAVELLEDYRRTFPEGSADEDALLLLSEIHLEMGSDDSSSMQLQKARDYLKEFLRTYPKSGNSQRASRILSLVEKELSEITTSR